MLNIYSYLDAHKYLRDAWRSKKSQNPSFSLNSWARLLGFENSSPLSLALKGKRALPKKYLPRLVTSLDLSQDEALYLEALLDYARSKSSDEKMFYIERLRQLAPTQITSHLVEEYKFLSEPLAAAILEMSDLVTFKLEPHWIQQHLRFHRPLHEIVDAIYCLLELGLLKKEESGKITKVYGNISSPNDIADMASRQFHARAAAMAAQAVQAQDVKEREFQTFAFNMNKRDLPKAKAKLRAFLNEFLKEFEAASKEGDATCLLGLQLFQVTR